MDNNILFRLDERLKAVESQVKALLREVDKNNLEALAKRIANLKKTHEDVIKDISDKCLFVDAEHKGLKSQLDAILENQNILQQNIKMLAEEIEALK